MLLRRRLDVPVRDRFVLWMMHSSALVFYTTLALSLAGATVLLVFLALLALLA